MMRYLTHLGGATSTIMVSLVLIIIGGEHRTLGLITLAANAVSNLPVQILKRLVARHRPMDATGNLLALVAVPDLYSFPSGHAAAAFAVATPIAIYHPSIAPAALGLAALVAGSRVTLRVHHATDVAAGIALGLGGAVAALAIL
jgi:undecaprenyl-diphosphatase